MKTILGWSIIVIIGAVLSVNAIFMLVSPRAWFRLPSWFRAQGSMTEHEYASGWGAIQVRSAGAIWLAFIACALYGSLFRHPLPRELSRVLPLMVWCIVAIVGVHMAINAGFMLASPRAWFRLPGWLRMQVPLTEQKFATGWGSVLVRSTGAMLVVFAWVLYHALIRR